jgi:hypothetical protein
MNRLASLLAFTLIASAGCSAHRNPKPGDGALDQRGFPFVLQGEDTSISLDFSSIVRPPASRQELLKGEVCRLLVGSCTIECFAEGSFLLLGPGDGAALVDGNPIWNLRPAVDDAEGARILRLYSTFFLIGGSVEKLPEALLDYLDDPGPRRGVAVKLMRQLVADGGGRVQGIAPGGRFLVNFQLTETGKDKLMQALQAIQEESGLWLVKRS